MSDMRNNVRTKGSNPYLLAKTINEVNKRKPKATIITLMGPVGVGKSTQLRLLKHHLRSNNVKVISTFIKSNHILAYVLNKFLIDLGISEKLFYSDEFVIKIRRDVFKKIFKLWRILDDISITMKFFFTVFIPSRIGFTVIIEEGLLMTFFTYQISIPHFLGTGGQAPLLSTKLYAWLINRSYLNIILDANKNDLYKRRIDRGYRQNELTEYVSLQKMWIRKLKNDPSSVIIETSDQSIEYIHSQIINHMLKIS